MWPLSHFLVCLLLITVHAYGWRGSAWRGSHKHATRTLNSDVATGLHMRSYGAPCKSRSRSSFYSVHSNAYHTSLKSSKSSEGSPIAVLLRTQNVIPTIVLNTLGGLMQRKDWRHLMSVDMIKVHMISVFIAFASCVVNDIVDMDVDKLNKPDNPLATGQTSVPMAYFLTFVFFFLPYWISRSMTPSASFLTESSIVLLLLYTPILKKIIVVKNLTCSFVIANTILLAATCCLSNTGQIFKGLASFNVIGKWCKIFSLCTTSAKMTFMSVFTRIFSRELEFDIRDVKGDAQMNIYTIPVALGVDASKMIVQVCDWIWKSLLGGAVIVWLSRLPSGMAL